ncbi:MAG: dTMP kinase [bacterium]
MFVVFEGGEGVGKSSQIKLLAEKLRKKGIPFITTKEPGGTREGKIIRRMLLGKKNSEILELFLFLADRKSHIDNVIKPALKSGKIVLCDRFFLSTIAYQGYGRGLDVGFIERLNNEVISCLSPDITFLIDLPPEKALFRKNIKDRFEMEDISFHKKIRKGYLLLSKKYKKIKVISGAKSKEEIHQIVMEEVEKFL